ncbi:inositol monophosphatase family protein [Propioniciclava coleopterorum]|uniref:inositol monophosphatase family protein n=1 Tax=Propioniciclava coleopterorum TaxID=2714937 RepID=UPI0019810D44
MADRPHRRHGQLPLRHPRVFGQRRGGRRRPAREFRPVAGAVYQPDHEELFWATADGPAWMRVRGEERELRASPAVDLGLSLVSTGFGYRAELRTAQAQILTRVLPRIRDIRRQGSAALELCYVAAGRQDAYYESGLNAWDLAAGWLIAERAGLTVRGRDGGAPDTDLLLAGRPEILDALQALIEA